MLSKIEFNAWSIPSNDNMSNLKKKKPAAYFLADSQRNIGIYKYSLKSIQDVGINYPKLVNCFFSLRA